LGALIIPIYPLYGILCKLTQYLARKHVCYLLRGHFSRDRYKYCLLRGGEEFFGSLLLSLFPFTHCFAEKGFAADTGEDKPS
jgi:hypothetical protein